MAILIRWLYILLQPPPKYHYREEHNKTSDAKIVIPYVAGLIEAIRST